MRCKIDEQLPLEIKELLVQHQHDAVTVAEQDMAGNIDPDVAQVCRKEGRALLTLDLDFSDIRAYPPEDYHGIVVFRPAIQSITTLVRLTTRADRFIRTRITYRQSLDCGRPPSPHPGGKPRSAPRDLKIEANG